MNAVLLTERQMSRIKQLPDDHRVVGRQSGAPVIRRPDGQHLLVQRNGRLTPMVEWVRSYLHVNGG